MTYKVQLPVFEGPLDLLLYLIKKDEINIYDIPISKITEQYLEYLEMMKLLDLEIAGEFIVMAATLMHIKSKMLLPNEPGEEEEAIEQDPREELVKRLIEYKKFKEAATELREMYSKQTDSFQRLTPEKESFKKEQQDTYFEASLFDLITAFTKVLKEVPKGTFHEVLKDDFNVSEKIHEILHLMVEQETVCFSDLFKKAGSRGEVVAIFLALLELVKIREVVVRQPESFGEIEVSRCVKVQNEEEKTVKERQRDDKENR